MTLTEEQRAALKRVVAYMDEMYAIASPYYGCTEDANILRAMIDSSEHFTGASKMIGFDLAARIRELEAENVQLLAENAKIEQLQKIIDSPIEEESWKADYDLLHQLDASGTVCVARKWHAAYRKAQNSNLLRKQENERMRADLDDSEKRNEDLRKGIDDLSTTIFSGAQAARIKGLEAENKRVLLELQKSKNRNMCEERVKKDLQQAARIKELKADLEQSERVIEARLDVIDQRDARIKELEDVHKRSGVKYAKIINELRSSVYANIPGLKKQWDEIPNAPANGKIGPDADAKPHCWQITEERKAAIDRAMRVLGWAEHAGKTQDVHVATDVSVLRAMLREAE